VLGAVLLAALVWVETAALGFPKIFRGGGRPAAVEAKAEAAPLGAFSTEYKGGSAGRSANIERAAAALDGQWINPGEIFSYNDAVGPTTKRNGFRLARIFINGRDAKGYGGGVCQVSSTLYNALLEAGLPVLERHPHSKAVGYVKPGTDAATSYGVLDLNFENDRPYPLLLRAQAGDGLLTVSVSEVLDA
jgi:vancomycin resistance protein YoaR